MDVTTEPLLQHGFAYKHITLGLNGDEGGG